MQKSGKTILDFYKIPPGCSPKSTATLLLNMYPQHFSHLQSVKFTVIMTVILYKCVLLIHISYHVY